MRGKLQTLKRPGMREKSGEPIFHSFFSFSKIFTTHASMWINRRFGQDSVEKMVDWALESVPASSDPRILEIGSGNGTLLFALREAGYEPPCLSGLDYSPDAVNLARMVARTRNSEGIAFHVCDFLSELPPPAPGHVDALGGWDLLLDKGTYDAIALGEKDESGRSPVAAYPVRASRLLKENGYFLITCKLQRDLAPILLLIIAPSVQFHRRGVEGE